MRLFNPVVLLHVSSMFCSVLKTEGFHIPKPSSGTTTNHIVPAPDDIYVSLKHSGKKTAESGPKIVAQGHVRVLPNGIFISSVPHSYKPIHPSQFDKIENRSQRDNHLAVRDLKNNAMARARHKMDGNLDTIQKRF